MQRPPWPAPTATDPVRAVVHLPGSKSITARALVIAAISTGPSTLYGPLRARDTELLAAGLRAMDTPVEADDDRHWTVRPAPLRGPARIDVGLAGTAMRFLPPLAGLANGDIAFDGDSRARERPMGALVAGLRALGVRIDATNDGLPMVVRGTGSVSGGEVTIDASASSQLVSGLLLSAPAFERGAVVRHVGPPVPSAPHLRMTVGMLRASGAGVDDSTPDTWRIAPGRPLGRSWDIEPDLSNAAPFLAAALVTGGEVRVPGWPHAGTTQPGDRLRDLLTRMGATCTLTVDGLVVRGGPAIHGIDVDLSEVGELTPVLAALAALADSPSTLRGVGHLRGHETDRLAALAAELASLGTRVTELPDGLRIEPRPMTGTLLHAYADHRLAQAAAVLGLAVPGVTLDDVGCTAKTLPDFPALWDAMVHEVTGQGVHDPGQDRMDGAGSAPRPGPEGRND